MSKQAIVLQLRPRWQQIRKQNYTHDEVIDLLCAFAQSLWPGEDPEHLREVICENFLKGQNEE